MNKLNMIELEDTLNTFEKINYDHCLNSSLHGRYKDVYYYKGFEACICSLKDYYNIKKCIDILNQIRYL